MTKNYTLITYNNKQRSKKIFIRQCMKELN